MKFQAPSDFVPDFSKSGGLIAAVAQDAATGEVLMLAWMNREAWDATLATGEAHYWSRSRQKLWHKGESSGNVQIVKAIRLDCDSDAVVLEIAPPREGMLVFGLLHANGLMELMTPNLRISAGDRIIYSELAD